MAIQINLLVASLSLLLLVQVSHSWTTTIQSPRQSSRRSPLFVGYEPFPAEKDSEDSPSSSTSSPSSDATDGGLGNGRLSDEELASTMGEWDDTKPRFNTVHLTGRIGNDPEAKYFDDGKVVVNLSLACKRKYHGLERQQLKLRSGEEATDWYGLEIWGQTAEFVSKYVDKGQRVGVIGSLQIDEWMDKTTQEPRNRVKVVVRDIDILETRAESEARRANTGSRRGPAFYTSDDKSDNDGGDGGPSSAGTGGFFDN